MNTMLTAEFVHECVEYNVYTGHLTWRERPSRHFATSRACAAWNARFAGRAAFAQDHPCGYKFGRLQGSNLLAHRVAWLLSSGGWPEVIDHLNGIKTDNRLSNLRDVTVAVNNRNSSVRADNTSGMPGVSVAANGRWRARIHGDSGERHLGYFTTCAAAIDARQIACGQEGYHPNHGTRRSIACR